MSRVDICPITRVALTDPWAERELTSALPPYAPHFGTNAQ
jgi:hypothetical protein